MMNRLGVICAAVLLVACASPEPAPPPMMDRSIAVAEPTGLTVHDTVRTIEAVYETTAVTIYDTVRLTVYDTVEVANAVTGTTWVTLHDAAKGANPVERTVIEPALIETLDVDRLVKIIDDDGLTPEVLAAIHGGVPQYTTVSAARLDSAQRVVIAAAFSLRPDEIRRFRWGHSMAPDDDPDAGRIFCAVWSDESAEPHMLRVQP